MADVKVSRTTRASKIKDITGQRFGRLTVKSLHGVNEQRRCAEWLCECDCGNTKIVLSMDLKSIKGPKSCGCLKREAFQKVITSHGLHRHKLYGAWQGMWRRCCNPNSVHYERYGGRGIKVCERWKDFSLFLADMGGRPKGHTLDRKDNNGPYSPENCRWATSSVQQRNTNFNSLLTYNGETKPLIAWAEKFSLESYNLYKRKAKGWSPHEILFGRPKRKPESTS